MATLTELYNKISTAEDFAKSSPIERAAIVTNNYNQKRQKVVRIF